MLLIELTVNSVVKYLSNEQIASLTNSWDVKVVSFDAPQFKIDKDHGGYCRMGWGGIRLMPDTFDDDWPPPITCALTAKYTATTEAAAETLFTGTAHIEEVNREYVAYTVYDDNETTNLLLTGTDYDGNTVPLHRAFGVVTHVNPVRLADAAGGNTRWDLGHIQGTVDVDWHVFDDGVDVCANVENVASNVFELNTALVGEITLSGTGEDTTLADIVTWASGATFLNYTFNGDNDRATSPNIMYWATSQQVLVDFLSKICSDFTHLFYISSSTLYLVDMLLDNGTRTITEFDYFPSDYNYLPPVANITSKWTVGEAGSWSDPAGGAAAAVYVKRTEKSATRSSTYAYGEEDEIDIYSDTLADINTALDNVITVSHKVRGVIRLPFIGSLPVPGEAITFNDTALGQPSTFTIRARTIVYDFNGEEIKIDGEGTISAYSALMLETGDGLLTESGDRILLEV